MSWDVASVFSQNVLSSWCHLFCELHQSLPKQTTTPQHDAATPVFHSWDGVLRLASFPFFPPNSKWSLWPNSSILVSSDHRTCFQKWRSLSLCAFANCNLAFLGFFWSNGFFLAEWPFSPCRYSTRFTVDNDTLLPASANIFTRSLAFVLGFICTFLTKAHSSLGHGTRLLPERYDGWTFPWCLCLHISVWTDEHGTFRHLEIAPKDEPDLCKSTILFLISWLISFDFPMMLHQEAVCFSCALKSTGVSVINSDVVNKPIRSFQRHHHLGFPKLFKGTVILVYVNFWLWRK